MFCLILIGVWKYAISPLLTEARSGKHGKAKICDGPDKYFKATKKEIIIDL